MRILVLLILGLSTAASSAAAPLEEAAVLFERSRWAEVISLLKDTQGAKADLLRGRVLHRLGRGPEAVEALERALQANPSSLETGLALGLAAQSNGQQEKAREAFEAAARVHPQRPEPWFGLGSLVFASGDLRSAAEAYEKGLALDPAQPGGWLALCDVRVRQGLMLEASQAGEKALTLLKVAAAHASAPLEAAALLFAQGRWKEVLSRLESSQGAEADLLRGLALRHLGRIPESIEPLSRALEGDPGNLDAALALGLAAQAGGQWPVAQNAFGAAARAHPERAEPWLGLGSLEAGRGNLESAATNFEKGLSLDARQSGGWLALSDLRVRQGRLRDAAEAGEKALALLKADQELSFRQAALWQSLGEVARAEKALAQAGAIDTPEAYLLSGALAHGRGDYPAAERFFRAALQARPSDPQASLNLGITLYAQERFLEARDIFSRVHGKREDEDQAQTYRAEALQAEVDRYLRRGSGAVLSGGILEAAALWGKAMDLAENKAPIKKMLDSLREQQKPRAEGLALEAKQAAAAGDLARAVLLWNDALSLDPENATARNGLKGASADLAKLKAVFFDSGTRLASEGNLPEARRWAERLGKLDVKAGRELSEALDKAAHDKVQALVVEADAFLAANKPGDALNQLEQALSLAPSDARLQARIHVVEASRHREAMQLLAKASEDEAAGRLKEAYEKASKALAMEPNSLEARREEDRLAARLELKRMDPRAVEDLYYQGVYLYGAGQTEKALGVWLRALEAAPGHQPLLAAVKAAETKMKSLAALGVKKP